jgi:hypothetical protein
MLAAEQQIANHPHLLDDQIIAYTKTLWTNWKSLQADVQKEAQVGQAIEAYGNLAGGAAVSFDAAQENSGLGSKAFARRIEGLLQVGQDAEGNTVERTAEDFVARLADYVDLPLENSETSRAINKAYSLIYGNNIASDKQGVAEGLELFRFAKEQNIVDRLGLSSDAVAYLTQATTALGSGDVENIADLSIALPRTFDVSPKNLPSNAEVINYLKSSGETQGLFSRIVSVITLGGDQRRTETQQNITGMAVAMIQNRLLYNAQRLEHAGWTKEQLLDLTLEQVEGAGVQERNGSLFRMPSNHTEDDILLLEKHAKEEAYQMVVSDRKEIAEIRAGLSTDDIIDETLEGTTPEQRAFLLSTPFLDDNLGVSEIELERRAFVEFMRRHDREPHSYQEEYRFVDKAEDMPMVLSSTFDLNSTASYYFTTPDGSQRLPFEGGSIINQGLSIGGLNRVITPLKNAARNRAGIAREVAELRDLIEQEEANNLNNQPPKEAAPTAQQVRTAKDASSREDKDLIIRAWQQSEYEKTGKTPKYSDYPN